MSAAAEPWKPRFNPWIIAVAVMLGTFMEVLDSSVANVALPHIAGSLSATPDEATWMLTSYLIANAVILPATGWLGGFFGRKRFLLFCIGLFTLSSALCGAAHSLGFLVLARVLQGAGGGALQPIAQAILLESFPPERQGVAMAAYGTGIVVAPIIGPTLGGWITDNYTWRWVFYINIPIGILAISMIQAFIEDPPFLRRTRDSRIDYMGFGLMAVWLGTMQVILDKGQEAGWLAAPWLRYCAVISALCFVFFIVQELRVSEPIVHLKVFANRNFAVGTVVILVVGAVLYSTTAMLPLFLQTLMGYPALQSGLAVSPRGLGSLVSMILVGRIVGVIDDKVLMGCGFGILALSMHELAKISANISIMSVVWPNIINGFALGFIFVPLTTATMGMLPQAELSNATGIYNLMRNLGGGLGISVATTLLERGVQVHQAAMVSHMTAFDPAYVNRLHSLAHALSSRVGLAQSLPAASGLLYGMLQLQAAVWVYVDNFNLLAVLSLLCIPLVLLFKKVRYTSKPIAAH